MASAGLWLLPGNDGAGSVHDAIASAPSGAGWLTDVLHTAADATAGHGLALTMAIVSAAIGVSVLIFTAQRTFLWLGVALSLVFWVAGQGLGGVLTGGATDVSTGPLVVLMASILLADTRASRMMPTLASPSQAGLAAAS